MLKAEPQNPQALVLAGTDAFFRSNFADAVHHWETVLAMLPPESPDARNLAAGIEKAKSQLGAGKASASPNTSPKAGTEAAAGKTVSGRVDLAPALKAKTAPDDVVFIFARAAEGLRRLDPSPAGMGQRARDQHALETVGELFVHLAAAARQQAVDLKRQPALPIGRGSRRRRFAQFRRQIGEVNIVPNEFLAHSVAFLVFQPFGPR